MICLWSASIQWQPQLSFSNSYKRSVRSLSWQAAANDASSGDQSQWLPWVHEITKWIIFKSFLRLRKASRTNQPISGQIDHPLGRPYWGPSKIIQNPTSPSKSIQPLKGLEGFRKPQMAQEVSQRTSGPQGASEGLRNPQKAYDNVQAKKS